MYTTLDNPPGTSSLIMGYIFLALFVCFCIAMYFGIGRTSKVTLRGGLKVNPSCSRKVSHRFKLTHKILRPAKCLIYESFRMERNYMACYFLPTKRPNGTKKDGNCVPWERFVGRNAYQISVLRSIETFRAIKALCMPCFDRYF